MGKSILKSIRNKLGQESGQGLPSRDLESRIADVSKVFPNTASITPATAIDPNRCFNIHLENGDRFLAWAADSELSGLDEEDTKEQFPDSPKAKTLSHTNILTPIHIGKSGNHTVVVTEYFEGSSLLNKIEDHKFDQKAVMTIFFQVASTFHTAHSEGVMHRALSPANILVDDELDVRVFGFGLSNVFFDHWMELLVSKKRRRADYIAPEVFNNGMITAIPNCDGYSVARVVYELLTRQLPKTSFVGLPSKLCDVPAYMDDALLNAMHSEPEKRPQTLADLHKQFAGLHARGGQSSQKSDSPKLSAPEKFSLIYQRYFRWVNSDWFRVAVVLVLFGLVCLGIYAYERYRVNPIMVSLGGYRPTTGISDQWQSLNRDELRTILEQDQKKFDDIANSTHQILIKQEKFDQAKEFETLVSSTRATQSVELAPNRVSAPRSQPRRSSITFAAQPRTSSTLRDASSPGLSSALEELKSKNPAQTDWHYHLLSTRQRTILDLSDHPNLKDISPLHGQVIHELDLSNTSVDNIFDLIGMPLDELRLCRTKITDLDPVIGLPLGVLSFIDTPIRDITAARRIPSLRSLLGQDANGPINEIQPPLPNQQTWINERGLKFRALPGIAAMIGVHEFPALDGSGPLTSVSFKEAQNLCSHMTVRERKKGKISPSQRYRLPTDGEWSYAALLPESRFLSPKGRLLQKLDESDFRRNWNEITVIEVDEGHSDHERFHNGFWDMDNGIGEWVDQSHGYWNGTNLVRGLPIGSQLENLRTRTKESTKAVSPIIGFRPILEIEASNTTLGFFDETDPEGLEGETFNSWDAQHLEAAATSAKLLSRLKSERYRHSFFSNQLKNGDPFENRLYLRVDVPMTWTRARAIADQLGGRLAVVSHTDHLQWIKEKYVDASPLGTPLWLGASAYPEKVAWWWVDKERMPAYLRPNTIDANKRRGALLSPQKRTGSPMTATPVSEKHAFLIEWDPSELQE